MDTIGEGTLETALLSGPETIKIAILCIVGVFAARLVFLRGRNRMPVLVPIGITVVLIGGLVLGGFFDDRSTIRGRMSVDVDATRVDTGRNVPGVPDLARQFQVDVDQHGDRVANDEADVSSLRIEQTDHGNMLVLPLSASILETYLGPEGTAALDSLSSAVSPELRQAYALVPIPGAVGDAVPGLHALATTIAHLTQGSSNSPASADSASEPETSNTSLAEVPAVERPAWLDQSRNGQIVVRGEFEETQELAQSQLSRKITQQLLIQARETLGVASTDVHHELRRLTMSDEAVEASIKDHFVEEVPIRLGSGPRRMFRTAALVEFPDEITEQAILHVKQSLQNQRAWTVGVTAISLGLLVMLAAGLMQLAGSSSRYVRWCGIPLVTLLLFPGVAVSGRLVHRVIINENAAEVPSPFQLPDTVIGVDSGAETPPDSRQRV